MNCTEISPHVEKFSISPQLSYMESWNFSTWQFFSTNIIRDIRDKYQVWAVLESASTCLSNVSLDWTKSVIIQLQPFTKNVFGGVWQSQKQSRVSLLAGFNLYFFAAINCTGGFSFKKPFSPIIESFVGHPLSVPLFGWLAFEWPVNRISSNAAAPQ